MTIKLSNYANPNYLAANTQIYRYKFKRIHMTIKTLYERQQDAMGREYNKATLFRTLDDGTFGKIKLENVLDTGRQIVYEIRTKAGFSLRATKDTSLVTNGDNIRVDELELGSVIFTNAKDDYKLIEDTVTFIERLGKEDTYSIEMDPLYNTFIANGFVIYYS